MKRIAQIIVLTVFAIQIGNGQTDIFVEQNTNLNNYYFATSDWGDFDNDGDLDLVISGALDNDNDESPDTSKVDFYENVNGTLTLSTQSNVIDLHLGTVKFVDIDYDNDLDLIVSGQNYNDITTFYLTVYENTNGTFSAIQQLEGVIFSSIDTGDYDNDGDLDLLVSGAYQSSGGASMYTRIYNNNNGVFSDANVGLPAVQQGNAMFGDFDKDQDLDILIHGYDTNTDNFGVIYTNENGTYSQGTTPFETAESWATIGDYDNDGDIDIAYIGYDENYDNVTKILNNDGTGSFTEASYSLEGVTTFSGTDPIVWGDYDNDGDLDLLYAGSNNDYDDITYLYTNTGSGFALASEGLINLGSSTSLKFIDFDNDHDLDILISGASDAHNYTALTRFFDNTVATVNAKPSAPTNLMNVINSDDSITFSWDVASDDFTPSNGLFYYLKVGTSAGTADIASYKVYGTSWTINNLGNTNYYWSVSAVDTAFVFSDEATRQTLSIENFSEQATFRIYPNPSTDKHVNLVYNANTNEGENEVIIYSMTGQKVYNTTIDSNRKSLDLSALANGIYTLTFTSGNQSIVKKLILN